MEMVPTLPSSSSVKPTQGPAPNLPAAAGMNYVGEADSTTHNVISIPDSDDIPNIEIGIISEGEVMDSINTKYNVSILKTDSSAVDSTTNLPKAGARSHLQLTGQTKPVLTVPLSVSETRSPLLPAAPVLAATPPRVPVQPTPPRPIFQQQQQPPTLLRQQDKMEVDLSPAPTHYITVSPLSKGSPKKPVLIKTGLEKKPTGREREYDPNKHCGVWDADAKRNCTRSLTCKSHSVYLKRKVINRSGPFDELLAAHKAEKEAALRLMETGEPTSILARRLQQAPATPQKQGCIKFLIKFVKFVGEEYQGVKRGRGYHCCGEEYNVKKRESGSIFPIILMLFGRISRGEGGLKFGYENQDLINGVGEEYQDVVNSIRPCPRRCGSRVILPSRALC